MPKLGEKLPFELTWREQLELESMERSNPIYQCECGNTAPNHHHCGISGWSQMHGDAPCPGCKLIYEK